MKLKEPNDNSALLLVKMSDRTLTSSVPGQGNRARICLMIQLFPSKSGSEQIVTTPYNSLVMNDGIGKDKLKHGIQLLSSLNRKWRSAWTLYSSKI